MNFHHIARIGLVVLTLFLTGCFGSSSGYDPANIKPVYQIRNSPIPVPWPNVKPTPPPRGGVVTPTKTPSFSGSTVTVKKGDTVYAISRRTGVDPKAIIAVNNLKAPYTLQPGDQLAISAAMVHVVKKGDTLYGISRSYGVDVRSLAKANRLKSPYALAIGQQIRIPGGSGGASSSAPQKSVLNITIPPREGSKFQWPITGKILSTFGPKEGGLHNDGVNIKARRGDKVMAADAGVVVYAGDDLKGYGNLLLIRHSGGWVTAYAHNDRLLVKRGDSVKKGAVIAWAGITGGVSEAQVHFEIRKGTVAVDPMKYLEG